MVGVAKGVSREGRRTLFRIREGGLRTSCVYDHEGRGGRD